MTTCQQTKASGVQLVRPPYMIYPWNPGDVGPAEDALVRIFHRLKKEGLYEICFHENPAMSFSGYMQFFTKPNTLIQLCVVIDEAGLPQDIAGLTWLSEFEQLPTHRRATGSFCFFRDYWNPKWTLGFGPIMLDYWFSDQSVGGLGINLTVGMTPALNRRAMAYCKKLGFEYQSRLPGYTSYRGIRCDAMIATMDNSRFERLHGQGL